MELRKILEIQKLIKEGVKLYAVMPQVSPSGLIKNNKVYEINNCYKYATSFEIHVKSGGWHCVFSVYHCPKMENGHYRQGIIPEDEINIGNIRIFPSKEDAEEALKKEISALSYNAIKNIDYQLKYINESRKKLDAREEKYLAMKRAYIETASKRFAK